MITPNTEATASLTSEVHRLYEEEGLGLNALVRRTGLSYSRVREALSEKAGVRIVTRRPAITPDEVAQCVALYHGGLSIHSIAKQLKKSYYTVKHHLRGQGVVLRGSNKTKDFSVDQQEDIVQRYQRGEAVQTISQSYGCSQKPILKLLGRRGIEIRDYHGSEEVRRKGENHRLPRSVFDSRKTGATRRGIEWKLTIDDVDTLFDQQKGLCTYTGLPMSSTGSQAVYSAKLTKDPLTLSIDRRDSSGGYTLDNVVLCCRFVNLAKSEYPDTDFRAVLLRAAQSICASQPTP